MYISRLLARTVRTDWVRVYPGASSGACRRNTAELVAASPDLVGFLRGGGACTCYGNRPWAVGDVR
jgi:hypothetical protein